MDILDILGRIGFDWRVALANLVNFLVIFWLLKRFAFKPIQEVIAKRQAKVKEGLDQAQAAATALEQAETTAEGIHRQARLEANEIVQAAHERSQAMVVDAATEAEEKRRAMTGEAAKAAEKIQAQAEQEFRKEAVGLVVAGIEKVLREEVTPEVHERITKKSLAALAAS